MPALDSASPDGMLIAAVLAGEREAFAHLVRRYQGPLLRAAISRLSQQVLAEDVVQETFLCALKSLHTYDSRYSFRTWLWTILLNQCSRQGKREARHAPSAGIGQDATASRVCSDPSPLEYALTREDGRLVHELLARLPDVQADALRLRFFGSLTFPEIAAAMQCSESGAKNRVKLGLVTMSNWLGESCIAATSGREQSQAATTGRETDETKSATDGRGYASGE
jgi:RNA polymerase sigma-70 factor, ECF subfamily